jgi:transmembrane sensor
MNDFDNFKPTNTRPDDGVLAAARAWADLIAERDLTPEERERFEGWLCDPGHQMEFAAAVEIPFRIADILKNERESLRPPATPIIPRYLPAKPRWTRGLLAAAAVVLLGVGAAWILLPRHSGDTHYSSGTGEKLVATLADGTRVELNTQTGLEWIGTGCDRRVRLARGEVFFEVHHDPRCPFRVLLDRGSIEVRGTRFDVYQKQNGDEQVSVLEGRVHIEGLPARGGSPSWQRDLGAGEQAIWGKGPPTFRKLDAAKAIRWRDDWVDFDNEPLADAVAELQRYTSIPIRIADPRLLSIRVSGGLPFGDVRAALTRLAEHRELQVNDLGTSLTLTYRAQAPQPSYHSEGRL